MSEEDVLMICKTCGTVFFSAECPVCKTKASASQVVCPVCGEQRNLGESVCKKCGYSFDGSSVSIMTPYGGGSSSVSPSASASSSGANKTVGNTINNFFAAGRLLYAFLLLFALISPVMLHGGLNLSGNGYENAFDVRVDARMTTVCALLFTLAIYSLIYGVYDYVTKIYYGRYDKGLINTVSDLLLCIATLIVSVLGCVVSRKWSADAGAGLSFCVFIGATGIFLFFVRIIFFSDYVCAGKAFLTKKFNRIMAIVTASVTVALAVVFSVIAIVKTCYTDPCRAESYAFAKTREDVLKQFGEPDVVTNNGEEYTYLDTEYVNINRMVKKLDEKMGENDYDEKKTAKLNEIREGLESMKNKYVYMTATIRFDNDGGFSGEKDTVVFYKAVAGGLATGEMSDLKIYDAVYVPDNKSAVISYYAEYESGCFIKNTVFTDISDYDSVTGAIVVRDEFGKFTIDPEELEDAYMAGDSAFIFDDTLYVFDDLYRKIMVLPSSVKKVKRIVVMDGVESITSIQAFEAFENAERISLPDSLTYINIDGLKDTAFYNDEDNWDKGIALYAGNMLVKVKENAILGYKVREGTVNVNAYAFVDANKLASVLLPYGLKNIGEHAFNSCSSLIIINIPSSVTSIGDSAFRGCNLLASITIPDGVTLIGDYAFSGCNMLESVIFKNTQGWWRSSSFPATSGTSISSFSLSDPAMAAKYLTDTYDDYYWTRG